jgi:hypothetical protein
MNDAQQRPAEQIRPIESVTASKVGEEHADPAPAEQPRVSALEADGASGRAHEINPRIGPRSRCRSRLVAAADAASGSSQAHS